MFVVMCWLVGYRHTYVCASCGFGGCEARENNAAVFVCHCTHNCVPSHAILFLLAWSLVYRFVWAICQFISDCFSVVALVVFALWTILYQGQTDGNRQLPVLETQDRWMPKLFISAVWLKFVDVAFLYWDLSDVDIFFVDWETVRDDTSSAEKRSRKRKKAQKEQDTNTARCVCMCMQCCMMLYECGCVLYMCISLHCKAMAC
eukprot:m.215855 g.215855  ORF g.215855 m.215855 type:complete len:203 (-) comp15105_c1_seq72:2844-3452(-)